ncbi:YqgE/AlgH family protein [Pseudofulvibacter geojedonensis]|uniref:YqgE/AlgH family protein n=1 Tax=Pseudofulvibacter geojedonensis TaxID=1123758 RepID=A0ABW3I054_9FLAO
MISLKPEKGHLLIAEPSIIGDLSFNRSVILLAEHTETGSIGFILNKPLDFSLQELIPKLKQDFKVYNGGPVEQDNLYFIHKVPNLIPNSIEITEGIYWGGDFDTVCELINNKELDDKDIRFFLGYSGWAADQLADEFNSNSWFVVENKYKNAIIEKNYNATFWKEKMIELGGDYLIWSNAPENPTLN